MSYLTRPAAAGDLDEIVALISLVMGLDGDRPERDFHRWKHEQGPFGPSVGRVALDASGEVVAVRLFMRWRFRRADGERYEAARAVDTVTHPSAVRQGLFSRLTLEGLDDLARTGVQSVFNTPNGQSRPGYEKLGWNVIGKVPMGVRPRPGVVVRRGGAWRSTDKWGAPTHIGLAPGKVQWDELPAAPSPTGAGIATDVTPSYLRWRYGFEPLNYRVMVSDDGPPSGAIVFRLRPRGRRLDLVVCEELGQPKEVARLVSRAVRDTRVDLAVRVQRPLFGGRFLRLRDRGPDLAWRPVLDPSPRAVAGLALTYGDLELF